MLNVYLKKYICQFKFMQEAKYSYKYNDYTLSPVGCVCVRECVVHAYMHTWMSARVLKRERAFFFGQVGITCTMCVSVCVCVLVFCIESAVCSRTGDLVPSAQ